MSALRQIYRGCFDMPHVGPHPGSDALAIFMLMAGLAGAGKGGWIGFAGSAVFAGLCVAPLFLWGAYDRANISDEMAAQGAQT